MYSLRVGLLTPYLCLLSGLQVLDSRGPSIQFGFYEDKEIRHNFPASFRSWPSLFQRLQYLDTFFGILNDGLNEGIFCYVRYRT